MSTTRRLRSAADVAISYAADERGIGVVFAAIHTGSAAKIVRLPFRVHPLPALNGLECGYGAVAAVTAYLRARGFGRVRLRLADARIVSDLGGAGVPPRALAMSYVHIRCLLHAIGATQLEIAEPIEVRDLALRAQAEICLQPAA